MCNDFFILFNCQSVKKIAVNNFLDSYIFYYYMTSAILSNEIFHTFI